MAVKLPKIPKANWAQISSHIDNHASKRYCWYCLPELTIYWLYFVSREPCGP